MRVWIRVCMYVYCIGPGKRLFVCKRFNCRTHWPEFRQDLSAYFLQNCVFNKKHDNTSLRVFYGGTLRIYNCNSCCKRWYFTFDGAECSKQWPLMGFCTCGKVQEHKIYFAIAILKVTVTRFPKATSKLDSGLEIVQVMAMQMLSVVGSQCLVLWLKKFLHLKFNSLTLLLPVFLHLFVLNVFLNEARF